AGERRRRRSKGRRGAQSAGAAGRRSGGAGAGAAPAGGSAAGKAEEVEAEGSPGPRAFVLSSSSMTTAVALSRPSAPVRPPPSDAERIARLNDLPENQKGEIIEGELFVQPRPRFRHARTTAFLTHHLGGPFDLDEDGPGGWWILPEPGIQ